MKALLVAALLAVAIPVSAAPSAWGQPMPEHCTSKFVWSSPSTYPQYQYADASCAKPWAANAVAFWNWFKAQRPNPK